MSTRFEWQASDDDGRWETIAQVNGHARRIRRRRALRWASASLWIALPVVIVSVAVCACIILRRYDQASKQIAFQIQSAIDLEAHAFSEGDADLFLAQQDGTWTPLYPSQARGFEERGRFFMPPLAVLPASVEDVGLRGDVAWVQVIEDDPPVRRVRFYRQTDQGWLHTAPDLAFWRDPIVHYIGDQLILRYHQRDQPYIDPLVQQLGHAFYSICSSIGCGRDEPFEILFYPAPAESDIRADLALPSPWLSGIPVDGEWSERYLGAALAILETRTAAWASTGDGASLFSRGLTAGQAIATERWLGLSAVTPEMVHLSIPLLRRGSAFRSRLDVPDWRRIE